MKKSYSLQTKLSVILVSAFMAIILMFNVTANYFINKEFVKFVRVKEEVAFKNTKESIAEQYNVETGEWNDEYLHSLAMKALEEGHIVKVVDMNGEVIIDVETHEMPVCIELMNDITARMAKYDPKGEGEFVSDVYPLEVNGNQYATLTMKHYKPFFFSEPEFDYLTTLNKLMLIIGGMSLVLAVCLGRYLAYKISNPIKRSINSTHKIAQGNYDEVAVDDSNTKELEDLSKSITLLANTLEKEEKAREQLTANLAHELRTPLTTLSTYVETMMLGVWEASPERLEELYHEINRLSTMVEDLEAIAKSDNDMLKLNKQEINLSVPLQQCIEILSQEAKAKSIEFDLNINKVVGSFDEKRMYQVFYNILHNAIKYSLAKTIIEVSMYEKNKEVVIIIKDNGIGIPKEELPFIFDRLYRSEKSRNRVTGGSGIGLSIAKSIVDTHVGNITVESDGYTYTTFMIMLQL